MHIRHYQPGDEEAQARVYNTAAGLLPRFKPATAEEITRRYKAPSFDPSSRFYAIEDSQIVGYAGFDRNGRISYPWCLTGREQVQEPLLDAVLTAMIGLGLTEAWAAYRGDWTPILDGLAAHGFARNREMINFIAPASRLPRLPLPESFSLGPLTREDISELLALRQAVCGEGDPDALAQFYWGNPYFGEESLFALRRRADKRIAGAGMLVINPLFADPTRLDSAMPCYRLGAFGTEAERHKRVSGMFSGLYDTQATGDILLSEAGRRLANAGLEHMAAQAASDQPEQLSLLDRYFERQASFPIVARRLT